MTKKPNGLYTVFIAGTCYFDDVTFDEGASGLLTVADHFKGKAWIEGELIADFSKW